MSKTYRLYQVDSFTKEKFKGNPAGVVPNADGLSERQMQMIARELNNSETAFIFRPEANDHQVRIRFFTPSVEVPSCGHATIAAHYVRAVEQKLTASERLFHKINIGVLPLEIVHKRADFRIFMTQGKPEFLSEIHGELKTQLLSALGLQPGNLDDRGPIQIVSTGHSKVMIGIDSRRLLNSLTPDFRALAELSGTIGCNGYFLFTLDSDDPEILVHGRMFAPAIGINEDPVTGNANGPLGVYLVRYKMAGREASELQFKARQGEAMGRLGMVYVHVEIENDAPVRVKVGGDAVIVFKTTLDTTLTAT